MLVRIKLNLTLTSVNWLFLLNFFSEPFYLKKNFISQSVVCETCIIQMVRNKEKNRKGGKAQG